jgi:lipopolysaccharide/colanic/teichoic acid biosynthesis glycosyltransferase
MENRRVASVEYAALPAVEAEDLRDASVEYAVPSVGAANLRIASVDYAAENPHLYAVPAVAEETSVRSRTAHVVVKRAMDIVGSAVLLLVTAPLMLVIALVIRFTSEGPVLFRQERDGYRGTTLTMLKFRTMVTDQSGMDLSHILDVDGGRIRKIRDDPRLTRPGGWLRRTSLDELPQLFNVLGGTMSLVGPRPLLSYMLDPHPDLRAARSTMRPGITGLWQISDRSTNDSALGMAPFDLRYVNDFSIGMDVRILLSTLPVWLSREGAI